MQDGVSNPVRDSAAKAAARSAAVSAALSDESSSVSDDQGSYEPPAAASEEPAGYLAQDAEPETQDPSPGASQGHPGPKTVSTAETQIQAPAEWPKDRQAEFNALPDNAKRILLARNKEFTQGIHENAQKNADHRKRSEQITEILKPYDADLRSANMDHAGAVRFMVQEREAFNRDPGGFLLGYLQKQNHNPADFVRHLIQRSGLTQDHLFPGVAPKQTSEPDQAEWRDPDVVALQEQIKALQGELHSSKQHFSQFQQQFSQRETLTIQEEIGKFSSAADASGNPQRPHFEAVKSIMKHLMDTDPEVAAIPDWKVQDKLQAAYDKAVWLSPDIRQQLIDSHVNQGVSSQMTQASVDRAKAAAAKKGSPGANGAAIQGKMSRKQAVEAALMSTGNV